MPQIVYTSIVNASTAQMTLAREHRPTENYLRDSGSAFVILRNGWYLENYTDQLSMNTQYHALLGSADDGLVSAASRRDFAAAATAVLTHDGHLGATYELGGTPFTLTELAATISDVLGTHVAYQDMSVADYTSALTDAGLPPEMAAVVACARSLERTHAGAGRRRARSSCARAGRSTPSAPGASGAPRACGAPSAVASAVGWAPRAASDDGPAGPTRYGPSTSTSTRPPTTAASSSPTSSTSSPERPWPWRSTASTSDDLVAVIERLVAEAASRSTCAWTTDLS